LGRQIVRNPFDFTGGVVDHSPLARRAGAREAPRVEYDGGMREQQPNTSQSNAGVFIAVVLLLLAVPCIGGVALVGVGAVFLYRAAESPPQAISPPPMVEPELPPESAMPPAQPATPDS
jgi:hypothetical protein